MPKAYLYNNFITRNIRFSNKEAMSNRTLNNFYGEVDVNGCQVTNTNSYVDIIAPDWLTDNVMFGTTYVRFNNDSQYEYMAFVDSVEPSNFNNTTRYYRLYITVDWWSTIMWNEDENFIEDIKKSIEGFVVRAHVDDIVKSNNKYSFTMDYTTVEPEFGVNRFSKKEIDIYSVYNSNKIRWLYFVTTRPYTTWAKHTPSGDRGDNDEFVVLVRDFTQTFKIRNKTFNTPLYIYCTPYTPNEEKPFYMRFKLSQYSGTTGLWYDQNKDIRLASTLSTINPSRDSNVILTFLSSYGLPLEEENGNLYAVYDLIETLGHTDEMTKFRNWLEQQSAYGLDFSSYITSAGGAKDKIFLMPFFPSLFNFNLKAMEAYKIPIEYAYDITNKTEFHLPANYEDYERVGCGKRFFAPYTNYCINTGDNLVAIDTAHILDGSFLVELIPDFSGQGHIVYMNSSILEENANYYYLDTNDGYERYSTYDEYTRYKAVVNGLNADRNIFNSIFSGVGGGLGGAISGVLGLGQSAENRNLIQSGIIRELRNGENGTSICETPYKRLFKPVSLVKYTPYESELKMLCRDLVKFGYNTYLHPHEVLISHKRKYFNYIQIANTTINLPNYNEFIRSQIADMFNKGVWLWNTSQDFGNFEVVNTPMSLEDENV